jgi:hypothetical protein
MRKPFMIVGLIALAAVLAITVAGCDHERLSSQWRRDAVTVDGDDGEWQHVPLVALDQGKTAVSLQHDGQYLYLLFKTRDQSLLTRIAAHGLQLWLDPYARKAKTFGVQFPVSLRHEAAPPLADAKADTAAARPGRLDPGMINRMLDESRGHIIITGPERDERCTLSVAQADSVGVAAGVKYDRGILVCELRLPLREDRQHPYAIAVAGQDSVKTIDLWLETAGGGAHAGERAGGRPHYTGGGIDVGGTTKPYDQETLDHREELSGPTRLDFWATVELRFPPDQR